MSNPNGDTSNIFQTIHAHYPNLIFEQKSDGSTYMAFRQFFFSYIIYLYFKYQNLDASGKNSILHLLRIRFNLQTLEMEGLPKCFMEKYRFPQKRGVEIWAFDGTCIFLRISKSIFTRDM